MFGSKACSLCHLVLRGVSMLSRTAANFGKAKAPVASTISSVRFSPFDRLIVPLFVNEST